MKAEIIRDLEAIYHDKPHRLEHVYGVRDTAIHYGKQFGCDLEKLELAALLHDITKYNTQEEHIQLIQSYFSNADTIIQDYNPNILHAFSAVAVAYKKYHITDEDILNAIMHHTVGAPRMSIYEEILFLSDYIEPNRRYDSSVKVRNIATNSWVLAIYTAMDDTITYHEKQHYHVPQVAYLARTYYKLKLEESE